MNLGEAKRKVSEIVKARDSLLSRVYSEVVKPFCDKYQMQFLHPGEGCEWGFSWCNRERPCGGFPLAGEAVMDVLRIDMHEGAFSTDIGDKLPDYIPAYSDLDSPPEQLEFPKNTPCRVRNDLTAWVRAVLGDSPSISVSSESCGGNAVLRIGRVVVFSGDIRDGSLTAANCKMVLRGVVGNNIAYYSLPMRILAAEATD